MMVLTGARLVLIPLLLALFCGFIARKFIINSAFYYIYIIFFYLKLSLDCSLNLLPVSGSSISASEGAWMSVLSFG